MHQPTGLQCHKQAFLFRPQTMTTAAWLLQKEQAPGRCHPCCETAMADGITPRHAGCRRHPRRAVAPLMRFPANTDRDRPSTHLGVRCLLQQRFQPPRRRHGGPAGVHVPEVALTSCHNNKLSHACLGYWPETRRGQRSGSKRLAAGLCWRVSFCAPERASVGATSASEWQHTCDAAHVWRRQGLGWQPLSMKPAQAGNFHVAAA